MFDSKIPITDHRGRKRVLWSNALFPSATADHVEREHARAARRIAWSNIDKEGRRRILTSLLICIPPIFGILINLRNPHRNMIVWPIINLITIGIAGLITLRQVLIARGASTCTSLLSRFLCPACGYHLRGLTPDPDHCTTCPECGAAWKLP